MPNISEKQAFVVDPAFVGRAPRIGDRTQSQPERAKPRPFEISFVSIRIFTFASYRKRGPAFLLTRLSAHRRTGPPRILRKRGDAVAKSPGAGGRHHGTPAFTGREPSIPIGPISLLGRARGAARVKEQRIPCDRDRNPHSPTNARIDEAFCQGPWTGLIAAQSRNR